MIETTCFLDYLQWRFFRVIWLVPYFFRILKLYQIWNFHKIYIKTQDQVILETDGRRESFVVHENERRLAELNRRKKCRTYFI